MLIMIIISYIIPGIVEFINLISGIFGLFYISILPSMLWTKDNKTSNKFKIFIIIFNLLMCIMGICGIIGSFIKTDIKT